MEQMLNEMVDAGGLFAFIVAIAGLLKYVMTLFFLGFGIAAFCKYLEKK